MKTLLAQSPIPLKDVLYGGNEIKKFADPNDGFGKLITSILPTIYIISGFILFLYMVFGGFMIISSAGDAKKTDQGKQALTNAIIGFVIIFASYWIIQIIEVITGIPILK